MLRWPRHGPRQIGDDRDQEEEGRPRRRARGGRHHGGVLAEDRRGGAGGPALGVRADDRDDAQGRARGPPGLPGQRQGSQGRAEQAQRLHAQGGAHERRRGPHRRAPRPRRHLRARGGAQGRARPDRHRVARDVDVRAGHVSARHSRHGARDIRLLDERRDGLGHHRQGVGGSSSGGARARWSPCTRSCSSTASTCR